MLLALLKHRRRRKEPRQRRRDVRHASHLAGDCIWPSVCERLLACSVFEGTCCRCTQRSSSTVLSLPTSLAKVRTCEDYTHGSAVANSFQ